VVDKGKHYRMEHRLDDEGAAWRQRHQDTGHENKKQHCRKERHHWVKHGYT